MFWGLTIDDYDKLYTQTVETPLHISMVALEPNITLAEGGDPYVPLMIQYEKTEYMLCSLQYGSVMQVPLDLNFAKGEELTLFINGKGVVHLSGYLNSDEPGYPELDGDDKIDLNTDSEEQDSDGDGSESIIIINSEDDSEDSEDVDWETFTDDEEADDEREESDVL